MKYTLAGLGLLLATTPALAETDIDRMARMSMALNEKMITSVVDAVPEAASVIPRLQWTQRLADAAACTLNEYRARIGQEGVDAMMDRMQALIDRPSLSMTDLATEGAALSPLPQDQVAAIEERCGMAKANIEQMMADPNYSRFVQFMSRAYQN